MAEIAPRPSFARVDFAFGAPDKWRAACTTIARHYAADHPVIVYSRQADMLQQFDLLLWGFEPTAFIPHVMATDALAALTPILLTTEPLTADQAGKPHAWLLNLDVECPPAAMTSTFERILEVVSRDEADVLAARTRWRHYQQQGCTLRSHDLQKKFQADPSP